MIDEQPNSADLIFRAARDARLYEKVLRPRVKASDHQHPPPLVVARSLKETFA
jgi:hypothetical protein